MARRKLLSQRAGYVSSAAVLLATCFGAFSALAVESSPAQLQDRTIGYVLNAHHIGMHATKEMKECPDGLNDGPLEEYHKLFPKKEGVKYSLVETELRREGDKYFPWLDTSTLNFKEAGGSVAPGLNLDGKVGAKDFTSPEGERGIDNEFHRVVGCIDDLRPGGFYDGFRNTFTNRFNYQRILIELTEVDSLENDDEVIVTQYQGRDNYLQDATGNEALPGGTIRDSGKWGKVFHKQMRGRIKDGVLITEPADVNWPNSFAFNDRGVMSIRDGQFKLSLTPTNATGVLGGYLDVDAYYRSLVTTMSTLSLQFGRHSPMSLYRSMVKLADKYPDPQTGKNTAISGALKLQFTQVYIEHPQTKEVASDDGNSRKGPATSAVVQQRR